MQDYTIGLSGLAAAQKALVVIGNNIANAATEGYHRQRVDLAPAYSVQVGAEFFGGGVDVAGVTRMIDTLLELEILRQQSSLGQVSREVATLRTIENTFGELSGGGTLSEAIDKFFNTLQDLCAHPSEIIWQSEVVTAGQNLAGQFRGLADFLTKLETQITLEAENTVVRINTLIDQIAEMNDNIERMEIAGGQANNLRDQRDQQIAKLAELIGIETQSREYGVVDVSIGGIPVVAGVCATEIQVGSTETNYLGISPAGAYAYNTNIQGGHLGALLSLKNELVDEVRKDLNALAGAIIQYINRYHVQGVGSEGSFTELTGRTMTVDDLADFNQPITDGKIYIRVTNTSTGEVTRHEIDVDVSTDSLTSIAAAISTIAGLSASASSSRLQIQAETDYTFDFLPAVLPGPTNSSLTGTSPPTISVSGIYMGSTNETYTFTAVGAGSVGNGDLRIEVSDSMGKVVTTVQVGAGYAAGDKLNIIDGIRISLSPGDLNAGDTFEIDAFANTDTSGLLAAVGMNTFFSGSSAADMSVCSQIINSPTRVATALGAGSTDNTNALRLTALREEAMDGLNGMTPAEFYRRMAADIGQQVSVRQLHQDNIEVVAQNLINRQSEISGVNINDEAAQLLVFEQMFQAMAKFLSTVQSSIFTMMEII
jgi:flagellar hook-associated protein FlgK